jgi:hypothetical protein
MAKLTKPVRAILSPGYRVPPEKILAPILLIFNTTFIYCPGGNQGVSPHTGSVGARAAFLKNKML